MIKVLRQESSFYKELEAFNAYMATRNIEVQMTPHNGIIYKIQDKYYKYLQDGEYPESLPPFLDGKYVECDYFGNTDYYQES